jgi:hypothetical protein
LIPGIVVLALVIIAIAWFGTGHGTSAPSSSSPKAPINQITGTTTPLNTTLPTLTFPTLSGGQPITLSAFLSGISAVKGPTQFKATFAGTVFSAVSTSSNQINGTITSVYERYNNSARSITSISSPLAGTFVNEVYYFANGTSYSCYSNLAANYTCQKANATFNSFTFGLSPFLTALPANYSRSLSELNSSYNGVPCTELLATFTGSRNNSGVMLNNSQIVSGCLSPAYKIPLQLNLTSLTTAKGSYFNGTAWTRIAPQSQIIRIKLHVANLTNGSSAADVASLPANAVIIG